MDGMNEGKSGHGNEGSVHDHTRHGDGRYWRQAHHDWRFWVGMVLMLAAITIYVLSDDLAFPPRGRPRQPVSSAVIRT